MAIGWGVSGALCDSDLACGPGRVSRELSRRGARVVGLDLSAALLDRARLAGNPGPGEIEYQQGRAEDPAALRAQADQEYPLGRIAQPREIARAAVFLASDDSCFVSGHDLVVDGGLLASAY